MCYVVAVGVVCFAEAAMYLPSHATLLPLTAKGYSWEPSSIVVRTECSYVSVDSRSPKGDIGQAKREKETSRLEPTSHFHNVMRINGVLRAVHYRVWAPKLEKRLPPAFCQKPNRAGGSPYANPKAQNPRCKVQSSKRRVMKPNTRERDLPRPTTEATIKPQEKHTHRTKAKTKAGKEKQ